jgi:hypothetical protein
MAYQFAYGKMASGQLDSKLTNVIVEATVSNVVTEVNAYEGAFLTLGNLAADNTYNVNGNTDGATVEYDTYYATAPAAATDSVVVLDPAVIETLTDAAGNAYRMGVKLYNKQLPAGWAGRARRLELGDKFWLGDSNFVSAPTVGQFATLTANDTRLTPAAAAGADFAIKVQLSKPLTAGMKAVGTSYLCEVVGL